jgi:hypothetical protein
MKSREIRRLGHALSMDIRNAYKILFGNPEGKR